jgi:hypothetical protein
MANQIVLAWTVSVANTPIGPVEAASRLAAVPLGLPIPSPGTPTTDPVTGQMLGLSLASDTTTNDATSATRTMTFDMTPPNAPPPFPCHPNTSTPPILDSPYPLVEAKTLPGSFFVQLGATNIPTTMSQIPSLSIGDSVQFLSQEGVFYTVASVGPTSFNLTAPYTGEPGNTTAFKEVPAPATICAMYSTSELDTSGVATVPAIAAGPGARTISINYVDPNGGSRTGTCTLTGKRPAAVTLEAGQPIAKIAGIAIASVGGFGNSVGQITLVELSDDLPAIPSNATPLDFARLTDEAQMLISRSLAYLPPSYFALAQQGLSMPQLAGDFLLTTGSTSVPTTEDQTGVLVQGSVIQFAEQMTLDTATGTANVFYTVAEVTPKYITLTTPFTGIDNNNTGTNQEGTNSNAGTKGNLGSVVNKKPSGAFCVALAQEPSSAQLSVPVGQFMQTEVAAPPPNPPLDPATVPAPTFLSGLYTRTLALAMAGVPITSASITIM